MSRMVDVDATFLLLFSLLFGSVCGSDGVVWWMRE